MANCYIINTNKSFDSNCEPEMIHGKKCSAYYSPWKNDIDKIIVNDLVFLYSNEVGIIARGVASGIPEIKDFNGETDEEHYMELGMFKELAIPLKASQISGILNRNVVLNSAQKKLNYDDGLKIWQNITKNCL